jgi:hypothetical protein
MKPIYYEDPPYCDQPDCGEQAKYRNVRTRVNRCEKHFPGEFVHGWREVHLI